MNKITFSILILIFCCGACVQRSDTFESPLDEATMINLLVDIHLAEAVLTEYGDRKDKDSLAAIFYHQIIGIHQVEQQAMEESLQVYFKHPVRLEKLYEKVEQRLKTLAGLQKDVTPKPAPPKQQPPPDSILRRIHQ